MLNKCEVTFKNLDVTENLKHLVERIQNLAKDKVDEIIPQFTSFKAPVQHLWEVLQKPIKINNQTWLTLGLTKFSGGRILVSDGTPQWVSTTLGVTFTPKIHYGSKPPAPQDTLPKLSIEDCQSGFEIHPEISFSFTQLDSTINATATNGSNEFCYGRRKITITDLDTYNSGQQVVIEARAKLRAIAPQNAKYPFWSRIAFFFDNIFYRKKGTLYLTGTPAIVTSNQVVELRNLKYDDATEEVLHRKAAWVLHTNLLPNMQSRAIYTVAPVLDEIKSALQVGLMIATDKFRLSVKDNIVTPEKVFIYKDRIYARFNMAIDVKGDYDSTP